jgi:glycosyltransferase involved in cell wall biosynthesis
MTVACLVISFNSRNTIIDTLNSIFEQDYKNIELVISDDCSTDDTCIIVDQWLEKYKYRFVECKFIKLKINNGIANNLNIGLSNVKSEWVKPMAADDLLLNKSISTYVQNVNKYNNELFFYSKIKPFSPGSTNIPSSFEIYLNKAISISKICNSLELQHEFLQKYNYIFSPAIFFNLKVFEITGGYDTEIPLLDDYPFYLKVNAAGINMFFIDEYLVDYRISNSSVQKNKKYKLSYYIFYIKYIKKSNMYKSIIWLGNKNQFFLSKILFKVLSISHNSR